MPSKPSPPPCPHQHTHIHKHTHLCLYTQGNAEAVGPGGFRRCGFLHSQDLYSFFLYSFIYLFIFLFAQGTGEAVEPGGVSRCGSLHPQGVYAHACRWEYGRYPVCIAMCTHTHTCIYVCENKRILAQIRVCYTDIRKYAHIHAQCTPSRRLCARLLLRAWPVSCVYRHVPAVSVICVCHCVHVRAHTFTRRESTHMHTHTHMY